MHTVFKLAMAAFYIWIFTIVFTGIAKATPVNTSEVGMRTIYSELGEYLVSRLHRRRRCNSLRVRRPTSQRGRAMSITTILNTGLALMGWFFIMFKTGQWFMSVFLKQWDKRRKQSRRQKAINEFYDAFDLSSTEPGTTVRLATKGDLTIMMFRQEAAK